MMEFGIIGLGNIGRIHKVCTIETARGGENHSQG